MPRLKIALLGAPEVHLDEKPVKTDRRKAVALLAYLACSGKSYLREHLATLLWPDYDRESALAYLRRTLWELNQMLGKGWLIQEGERLGLQVTAELWMDTAVLEASLQASATRVDLLTEAVSLYRGDFLDGFMVADTATFEAWQTQQAAYYRSQYATALQKLVQALEDKGERSLALNYAHRWLALELLNEAAHCAIMRLLAGMGDRSGAIRQYESCIQTLKNELNIPPQPETIRLYQAILHGELGAAPTDQPRQVSTEVPHPALQLPVIPTPFIGRRSEVEQIKLLLQHPTQRLVTLTGPGGSGKTRLSIQVAAEVGQMFPDGVYFAALAAAPTAEAVLPLIAKALDFTFYEKERPRQQLIDYLREKRLLLVLDNFEHLLDATGLVAIILANAPDVKLLVTSRVRLSLQGEQLFRVGGMQFPALDEANRWDDPESQAMPFSAVQLFLERACRVQPGFTLTKANLQPTLEICHLVQGVPLGLELAAAWLELLSPAEIAEELHRSLDILETNLADVPERQRSIRGVFQSSWRLLSQEEQDALQYLSVFGGSFSRSAAQEVSRASLRTLLGLVDKSWLQQTEGGCFQLHDLLRRYALEQLKTNAVEWQKAHDRHAAIFIRFVSEQNERLRSSDQLAGKRAFEEELNTNIKVTWDWLVAQKRWAELLDPLAIGLFHLGTIREQMAELIPWMRNARLTLAGDPETAESLAYAVISTIEVFCEESEWIRENDPIQRMAGIWQVVKKKKLAEPMGLWFVLLAFMVHIRNLDFEAEARLEEAVARLRKGDNRWYLGIGLFLQAIRGGMYSLDQAKILEAAQIFKEQGVWHERGRIAELLGSHAIHQKQPLYIILEHYQEARQFFSKMGNETRAILNFLDLAGLYFRVGLTEQGFDIYHETQRALEQVGNTRMLAISLHWESLHATRYSTFSHAQETRQRSMDWIRKLGYTYDLYMGLYESGEIYRVFGQIQTACTLYEEAHPGFRRLNMILGLGYYERSYGDLALQAGEYHQALARYRQYADYASRENHPWSMAQARAKCALAEAYQGNQVQARQELRQLLKEIITWGEDELLLIALLVEPVCLMQEGRHVDAVAVAELIHNHPVSWNEIRLQAQAILKESAGCLSEKQVEAAIQRGKALKLESVIADMLDQNGVTYSSAL